jgi:hypothetical protein
MPSYKKICAEEFRCICKNKDGSRCKNCRKNGHMKCATHLKYQCNEQISEYYENKLTMDNYYILKNRLDFLQKIIKKK